ncbi:MAG: hypothetical protein IPH60_00040 [Flavobacteriales bacterium]|nr:hypothetical protein [Flavobacteriales bacterium]
MQYIGSLATGQCRALLSELVELPANAEAVKNGEFNPAQQTVVRLLYGSGQAPLRLGEA